MKERFYDLERQNQTKSKDKSSQEDRIESLEKDVDHIMSRGETSNVSGVPTLVSLKNTSFCLIEHIYRYKYINEY